MELADEIQQLAQVKNISVDTVENSIKDFLLLSYKRTFGGAENGEVVFLDNGQVKLFARKTIVEKVKNTFEEISLEEAKTIDDSSSLGGSVLVEIDPKHFKRSSIKIAKDKINSDFKEMQTNASYIEYKDKLNEVVIGYYQRERNGNIFLDLGQVEGFLPASNQSPREHYKVGDRLKVIIKKIEKTPQGLNIVVSRSDSEFVRKLFELEIPEIYEGVVKIQKVVRSAGYKTKLSVYSNKSDIDPVGTCIGLKGVRIQNIIRELEGEKVDVILNTDSVKDMIRRSLTPAKVSKVYILDEVMKKAIVVVEQDQLAYAVGQRGLNVRLASRLLDWSIEIKTEEQAAELNIIESSDILFKSADPSFSSEQEIQTEERIGLSEIVDMPKEIVAILEEKGIVDVAQLFDMSDEQLLSIEKLSESQLQLIKKILSENIEVETEQEPAMNSIDLLPDLEERIIKILRQNSIEYIEQLAELPKKTLESLEGLTSEDVEKISNTIAENVEILEED